MADGGVDFGRDIEVRGMWVLSPGRPEVRGKYSTNHVYLHRPNAFGFWQPCLQLCYETL